MHNNIVKTQYWHQLDDGRIQCDLCPRFCKLHDQQRGLCFVRQNLNQAIVLTSYGRSSGFCIDPIEKKSLNHFYHGTSVFSFGTAGCDLACKFCLNWDISKSREMDSIMSQAEPSAIDTAQACKELGIKSVSVSVGYVCAKSRSEFYHNMDAANIDLKAFSKDFYHTIPCSHIQAVIATEVAKLNWTTATD